MYPTEYEHALRDSGPMRYSLRTRAEWQPFVDQVYQERLGASGQNFDKVHKTTRGVLADFFDDVGDPRGTVLRGAVNAADNPKSYVPYYPPVTADGGGGDMEMHRIHFPHDNTTVTVTPVIEYGHRSGGNRPTHVYMGWAASPTKGIPLVHGGMHTPDEARTLADRLPDPHADQLHAFLDKHFGGRT